eukprot:CAMPEP_0171607788 /NCGR_PEP_ID=MMETSP0990-20121206/8543_1 /TAXON_ID=483369 /ORGANISM="non described non described, Strain CCMP2098" /LENGTH=40 /DNA_ID= /DNA_START= /DNA_END= /DNA_ORIENTATION=
MKELDGVLAERKAQVTQEVKPVTRKDAVGDRIGLSKGQRK